MDHPFGDPLPVEVAELFDKVKVREHYGAVFSHGDAAVFVRHGYAGLIGDVVDLVLEQRRHVQAMVEVSFPFYQQVRRGRGFVLHFKDIPRHVCLTTFIYKLFVLCDFDCAIFF